MRTLADTSLSEPERRALEAALRTLEDELGDDLLALRLYGSRARGEGTEDSDVDLLVLVTDERRHRERVPEIVHAAADEVGVNPFAFSVFVHDPRWVARERAIQSLYLREVETDGVELLGGERLPTADLREHELPPLHGPSGVLTRSLMWLDMARGHLGAAQQLLDNHGFSSSIAADAYYAMFYAARAALSEEGRVGRTHEGTWHLMRELFVESGRFDRGLVARAQAMQEDREGAHYKGWIFEREENESHVRDARRFVEAVERLIGAGPATS